MIRILAITATAALAGCSIHSKPPPASSIIGVSVSLASARDKAEEAKASSDRLNAALERAKLSGDAVDAKIVRILKALR